MRLWNSYQFLSGDCISSFKLKKDVTSLHTLPKEVYLLCLFNNFNGSWGNVTQTLAICSIDLGVNLRASKWLRWMQFRWIQSSNSYFFKGYYLLLIVATCNSKKHQPIIFNLLGLARYKCNICDEIFETQSNLYNHINAVHLGDKEASFCLDFINSMSYSSKFCETKVLISLYDLTWQLIPHI